jgi:quinol monooxygenase YgiN
MAETVIRADDNLTTVINVFEVEAAKQDELVSVLIEGADKVVRHRPGFVSANILASRDGTRVVNYAQWRSAADLEAILTDPAVQEYGKKAATLGRPAPTVYSVVSVFTAP